MYEEILLYHNADFKKEYEDKIKKNKSVYENIIKK